MSYSENCLQKYNLGLSVGFKYDVSSTDITVVVNAEKLSINICKGIIPSADVPLTVYHGVPGRKPSRAFRMVGATFWYGSYHNETDQFRGISLIPFVYHITAARGRPDGWHGCQSCLRYITLHICSLRVCPIG